MKVQTYGEHAFKIYMSKFIISSFPNLKAMGKMCECNNVFVTVKSALNECGYIDSHYINSIKLNPS